MIDLTVLQTASGARRPRSYHLVDIENLAPRRPNEDAIRKTWERYAAAACLGPDDAVLVGCCQALAAAVCFAIPCGRQFVVGGRGRDAADIAIHEAFDLNWTARRFERVVIGSGDGTFATTARALAQRGIVVVNVSRNRLTQSHNLRLTAPTSVYLDDVRLPAFAA